MSEPQNGARSVPSSGNGGGRAREKKVAVSANVITEDRSPPNGRSRVLDQVGGPDLDVRHLPEPHRAAAWELLGALRLLCGSLDRGPYGRFELQPNRASWRSLRDVDEDSILFCVRQVQRSHPSWLGPLPGPGMVKRGSVHELVEEYLIR